MRTRSLIPASPAALLLSLAVLCLLGAANAETTDPISLQAFATITPGHTTKAELQLLLGVPWRVVQFNDCGEAMDDQADETWEYRGGGTNGAYRVHVEFDDHGIVHLIAKIPNNSPGGKGTTAKTAPVQMPKGMSM
jgi:hypothetical protein